QEIEIEHRPAKEMTMIKGIQIAAEGIDCWNPGGIIHYLSKMIKIILFSLLAVAFSQIIQPGVVIDSIHGYRVEYDDTHDIILLVGTEKCYIVEAPDRQWDSIVRDVADLNQATEEIYQQIVAGRGVTSLSEDDASSTYHSSLEQWQCRGKILAVVSYTP
ncbi:hypothetical protein MQA28_26195, partial [Escherichia coli]|nr:hypothetical protein [Escherichia coli]